MKGILKKYQDCHDICSTLVEIFLDAGADVDKEMCQKLCSGGVETSTVLHACLSGFPVSTFRQLLRKAEVDKRKVEQVSSVHGAFQDSCKTALYIVCSTSFSRCCEEDRFDKERRCLQIANALLDFGADPNALNTKIVQIDSCKYSEDTDD